MHNLWLEFLVEKFVDEKTQIRCCGSCQGGCLNPAICAFICCHIPLEEFINWYQNNKEELCKAWENTLEPIKYYNEDYDTLSDALKNKY